MRLSVADRLLAVVVISILSICAAPLHAEVGAKRVLIVTTGPSATPRMQAEFNGEYAIGDLTAAGYPFDVVTYTRFATMDLGNHDVILLFGHTSPQPVSAISAKCQAALTEGRKVFLSSEFPMMRYEKNGVRVEDVRYSASLFNVINAGLKKVSGVATVPSPIEKDSAITASVGPDIWATTYAFKTPPLLTISMSGSTIGFVYPQGGVLSIREGTVVQNALDYGKLVSYLRYGSADAAGFANDRIGGSPLVSFEVHCDVSSDLVAIDGLDNLSRQYGLPLINLLVYNRLNPVSIKKWNALTNPLMTFGSHTYSHPPDWPTLPDVLKETSRALELQKQVVPSTRPYLNFSGSMNPTPEQLTKIQAAGVAYGGAGSDPRQYKLRSGEIHFVQRVPTYIDWIENLSQCETIPYPISYTFNSDWSCWKQNLNFITTIEQDFAANIKYGLYSFGCIHDYMLNPTSDYYWNGVHFSTQIDKVMDFLTKNSVSLIATDELIAKLRDFQSGWIDHENLAGGGQRITVYRPNAKSNEIKIKRVNGQILTATGASVASQRLGIDYLYVGLVPETTSTFEVYPLQANELQITTITGPEACTLSWTTPDEPGLATVMIRWDDWTFPTTPAQGRLFGTIPAVPGTVQTLTAPIKWSGTGTACFSVILIRNDGRFLTPPGLVSVTQDVTPPTTPVLTRVRKPPADEILQWLSTDPESGITGYAYALGRSKGANDVSDWLVTSDTSAVLGSAMLGQTLYISVKARNGFGRWSEVASMPTSQAIVSLFGATDGESVITSGCITAIFADCYYVEQDNRAKGIKIIGSPGTAKTGDRIVVTGTLTTVAGERCVVAD